MFFSKGKSSSELILRYPRYLRHQNLSKILAYFSLEWNNVRYLVMSQFLIYLSYQK